MNKDVRPEDNGCNTGNDDENLSQSASENNGDHFQPEESNLLQRDLSAASYKLLFAKVKNIEENQNSSQRENQSPQTELSLVQREFSEYMGMTLPIVPNDQQGRKVALNPILFWKDQEMRFPSLTKMAFTLISNPASSAKSERLFSASGWLCDGKKTGLKKKTLQHKCLFLVIKIFCEMIFFCDRTFSFSHNNNLLISYSLFCSPTVWDLCFKF